MGTYRHQLRELALDQHGYVTVQHARAIGVPPVELRKLAARGFLERVGHTVYRMKDVPISEEDQFVQAVLLVGRDAHLTHDAVLALHGLALVNPRRIAVGTPHRVRKSLPAFVSVVQEHIPDGDLTTYLGIPCTTVARSIADCIGTVMSERLRSAVRSAHREGLLTRSEAATVRAAIARGTMLGQPVVTR